MSAALILFDTHVLIGSTHMMIFQKDRVRLEEWAVHAVKHQNDSKPTPFGSVIARALRKR